MPPLPQSDSESRDGDDFPRRFRNIHVGNDPGMQRRTDPFQYENVHVLLFCWEEDDSGGWGEMSALADVFRRGFGFNVNRYRVPNYYPYQSVEQTLRDFKQFTLSPNNLVIVFFHGHANFADRVRLRASARRSPDPWLSNYHQEMDLSGIMISLQSMGSDVLFLLQTCWAGGILSTVEEARVGALDLPQNRVEIMTSCGYKTTSPPPGPNSFCSALIEELRSRIDSGQNQTFNTAQLYRGIYHRLLNINLDLPRGPQEMKLEPTSPIHISLDDRAERASIPLKVIRRNVGRNHWGPQSLLNLFDRYYPVYVHF